MELAFSMVELIYRDVTLEVLSSFEINRSPVGFYQPGVIQFQIFIEPRRLSDTNFSLLVGMYDTDYTLTQQYEELAIDFSQSTTPEGYGCV